MRDFNPRSPHGERRALCSIKVEQGVFQSTLPARGATTATTVMQPANYISIHAPRTGSDRYRSGRFRLLLISIHAPRTGSDLATVYAGTGQGHFNPRSPHGERLPDGFLRPRVCHFNPRSPHGERHLFQFSGGGAAIISIHAPRTGSDILAYFCRQYSTISIHAPRTGSDESCRGVSMRL